MTTTHPNVPLPDGAVFGDTWQPSERPYRVIEGPTRRIAGRHDVSVWTYAYQFLDGGLDDGSYNQAVRACGRARGSARSRALCGRAR